MTRCFSPWRRAPPRGPRAPDPPSLHAEYCRWHDFDAASRDNSCVGFGAAKPPRSLQLTFSDCSYRPTRGTSFSTLTATTRGVPALARRPHAQAQRYSALCPQRPTRLGARRGQATAPPQPTISVTTIPGWRMQQLPPPPPSPAPSPTSPVPPPPNQSLATVQQVSSGGRARGGGRRERHRKRDGIASHAQPTSPSSNLQKIPEPSAPSRSLPY